MEILKCFGRKSWADITRDERYYCSHLYHSVIGREKKFVICLSEKAEIEIDPQKDWEIGFEVVFYRDFLKFNGETIIDYNRKHKTNYPSKRTFDLCLFSQDEMITIEAKAQQGFKGNQLDDIANDKKLVEKLTK